MATIPKIKIVDDSIIREEIDDLYEVANQIVLAKWSLSIAKHILFVTGIDYKNIKVIEEGFQINERWQSKNALVQDVRQAGFKIHKLARENDNEIQKNALRVFGQAVSSGHMREHSMVASDYAIKVIGLLSANDKSAISKERKWQLEKLKNIISDCEKIIV